MRRIDRVVGSVAAHQLHRAVGTLALGLSLALAPLPIERATAMVNVGRLKTPGWANAVAVAGDVAYIADQSNGLRIVDVSDDQEPVEISFLLGGGSYSDVAVAGDIAYALTSLDGLKLIDVSNPYAPTVLGQVPLTSTPHDVEVIGTLAYVTDAAAGVTFGRCAHRRRRLPGFEGETWSRRADSNR